MLGLFEHARVRARRRVKLEPGDFIVAFSDGVTEAMNADGEEFTDDRLLACANAHRGAAAAAGRSTRCSPTSTRSAPARRRATT